uniref:Uncharacterized protein n=1 Tax=Panagrolaimus sp. JU765 TaxID=591449 RepID=A0AC34RA17_9BILA
MESCWFVTALSIDSYYPEFNYVDFYEKLRHLKSFKVYDPSEMIMDLPYFPPKLVLRCDYPLPLLAEKTKNHPLSFLKITEYASLADLQQFLTTANLEIGAEIRFRFGFSCECFLTFIGNDLFEFEVLRGFEYLTLEQEMNSQNKKMLNLSADLYVGHEKVPLTVTSVSNPEKVVSSGELTDESPEIVFENVAECVKVSNPVYSTHYSRQLLERWFPRTENYDPFERVETINKTLGTYISVISPEMLKEKRVQKQLNLLALGKKEKRVEYIETSEFVDKPHQNEQF